MSLRFAAWHASASELQRITAASQVSAWAGERIDTIGCLGDLAGCSRQTLQYVRIIVQHADQDMIDRLRRGKLSIAGVYKQLQPSQSAPSTPV